MSAPSMKREGNSARKYLPEKYPNAPVPIT